MTLEEITEALSVHGTVTNSVSSLHRLHMMDIIRGAAEL